MSDSTHGCCSVRQMAASVMALRCLVLMGCNGSTLRAHVVGMHAGVQPKLYEMFHMDAWSAHLPVYMHAAAATMQHTHVKSRVLTATVRPLHWPCRVEQSSRG